MCAPARGGNTTGTTHNGWTVRISPDVDLASIKPSHFKLLVILEGLCRDRSYCWPTNETLARLYGCDTSNGASSGFRRLLLELERDEWISRQEIKDGRPGAGRLGFFLHRRLNHDAPVEDGPPPPPEAVERLRNARESACTHAPKGPTPMPQKGYAPMPQKGLQKNDELESGQKNDDKGPSSSPLPSAPESPDAIADPPVDAGILELLTEAQKIPAFAELPARKIQDAVAMFTAHWVELALVQARVEVAGSWAYCLEILRAWQADGAPSLSRKARKAVEASKAPTQAPTIRRAPPKPPEAAEKLLGEIREEGFGVALGDDGAVILIAPEPPLEYLSWRPSVRKMWDRSRESTRSRLQAEIDRMGAAFVEVLRAE